ncbi:MAG: hypothetical protein WB443_00020 [Nitrososphaeraceae archaeon]
MPQAFWAGPFCMPIAGLSKHGCCWSWGWALTNWLGYPMPKVIVTTSHERIAESLYYFDVHYVILYNKD